MQLQFNALSKQPYSGENAERLAVAQGLCGFEIPVWLTYKQARALGAQVKAKQKGFKILFFSKAIDKLTGKRVAILKTYTVFNVSQCERISAEACSTDPADAMKYTDLIEDGMTIDAEVINHYPRLTAAI